MRIVSPAAAGILFLLFTAGAAAQADFSTSLHATRAGKAHWYEQGFKLLTGIDIANLGCTACHGPTDADGNAYSGTYQPGCVDCHPSGNFSRSALRQEQCFGCHSRQAQEVVVGMPDVHRSAGLQCWDCHKATEIHGDGTVRNSLFESGGLMTECSDCHVGLPSEHSSYDPHGGKLHCTACHTATVISCYNCHFESQVDRQIKRPKEMISGFVLLVNRTKDGKVGTASFQSLTYQGKSFAAFGPYHGHTITKEGRRCVACHFNMGGQNAAIQSYNSTGMIPFASWNSSDSTLSWMKGVIPMPYDYERTFKLDFLTYDGSTADAAGPSKNWSLVASEWNAQHMLFATPLTPTQMEKLGFILTSVKRLDGTAAAFALEQNHPNPFSAATTIRYTLAGETMVALTMHDALGRRVRTLVSGRQSGGTYEVTLDAAGLDKGVYFYRLDVGGATIIRKMLLLK
ncbi:MAG: T9SS type A sorting domain-containing protein [Bacteroidetes bacterium]|nr:T9SS type A sorting domain-containing protein [Bacteroidota bacterium]